MGKNIKQWIWVGGVVILMLITGLGYRFGWRIQNNFLLGRVGTLSVTLPLQNIAVFVDNNQKITSTKDSETVNITLSPRKHTIIVSKESYFPWTKDVKMPSGGKINLYPILVSQNATGQIINQNDSEYWKIKNQIRNDKLPTKDSPLISADKLISVWVENNTVVGKIGENVFTIISPNTVVNNLSFYKNRSDALIFSTADSVFMIETDTENIQNFMPIYKGKNPRFIETNSDFIYVEDDRALMLVII